MPDILFSITGHVKTGHGEGRKIGFPTANLDVIPHEPELKPGVYIGNCEYQSKTYQCLAYFGPRLVAGETANVFEVFIHHFSGDLYGQTLTVHLTAFVRPPMKFDSFAAMQLQLEQDKTKLDETHTIGI